MSKHFLTDFNEWELNIALQEIRKELTVSKGKGKPKELQCYYQYHLIKDFIELAIRYRNDSPVANLEKRLVELEQKQEDMSDDLKELKDDEEF